MENDEEYLVPLQDQRVFGAGIKRSRVPFVPARTDPPLLSIRSPSRKIGERYLSIVLKEAGPVKGERTPKTCSPDHADAPAEGHMAAVSTKDSTDPVLCEICRLPIGDANRTMLSNSRPHEASLAHQVCLVHSHPPSHLDRTRKGLRYLSSYGWDPDSRLGLGAVGQGIRIPIKAKQKNNTLGLGAERKLQTQRPPEKKQKLDAKQVRLKEQEARRKREKLQELFYRNDDVERYLGQG